MATEPSMPNQTPPRWLNVFMKGFLRTPGLQKLIGRGVALITVTGRKTGTRYTTPVSYHRDDGTVVVLTKKPRTWWRNLDANPDVELRLAGTTFHGRAHATIGDPASLPRVLSFLEHRRRDARFYGLEVGPDGRVDESRVRELLPHLVVVEVTLADEPTGSQSH